MLIFSERFTKALYNGLVLYWAGSLPKNAVPLVQILSVEDP